MARGAGGGGIGGIQFHILRGGLTMAIIDRPAVFAAPGEAGSPVSLKARYDNFIGGEWVAPV